MVVRCHRAHEPVNGAGQAICARSAIGKRCIGAADAELIVANIAFLVHTVGGTLLRGALSKNLRNRRINLGYGAQRLFYYGDVTLEFR